VLFIKRTELALLPVYLELKEFTSLTSKRQHYLTGEVEARFHYSFYIYTYICVCACMCVRMCKNCVKWKQNRNKALEIL